MRNKVLRRAHWNALLTHVTKRGIATVLGCESQALMLIVIVARSRLDRYKIYAGNLRTGMMCGSCSTDE